MCPKFLENSGHDFWNPHLRAPFPSQDSVDWAVYEVESTYRLIGRKGGKLSRIRIKLTPRGIAAMAGMRVLRTESGLLWWSDLA